MSNETDTDELEELLGQLQDELADINLPASKLDLKTYTETGHEVQCGVCERWYSFGDTYVVEAENFDYDDWNTQVDDEIHEPFDQDRACWDCVGRMLNDGEFTVPDHL